MLRATSITKHSRVYSSMIGISLSCRPSSVVSKRKWAADRPQHAPHVVRIGCLEPRAAVLARAQAPAFALLLRHLQAGLLPETMHSFAVDQPAMPAQELGDHPVAGSWIGLSQLVHLRDQRSVGCWPSRPISVSRTRLAEHPAGLWLAHAEFASNMTNGIAATRRATDGR